MRKLSNHREDVKAAIRKRFGSLRKFENARELAPCSVTDVLRGKPSQRTAVAIADELGCGVHELFPGKYVTANADCSCHSADSHRQNVEAR